MLVRVRLISLDAANRAWMQGATYREAVTAGSVMAGGAVAEVMDSKAGGLSAGDLVFADTGWQDYAALPARRVVKLPKVEPMTHLVSVYGVAGLTAYFGLLRVGEPKPGETVVVSAASGAVGSVVGQLAKLWGCRAVGIAGGREKCDYVTGELGFDACLDYKAGNLRDELRGTKIDVYFDNVGGEILDLALARMNLFGRVVVCGTISDYNATDPYRVKNWRAILVNRLKVQGMIVFDWKDRYGEALKALGGYLAAGKLKTRESVVEGLANAPQGFISLLKGGNFGKQLVKLA